MENSVQELSTVVFFSPALNQCRLFFSLVCISMSFFAYLRFPFEFLFFLFLPNAILQVVKNNFAAEVFRYSHVIAVKLVAAQHVEGGVTRQSRVLVLDFTHDVLHRLAVVQFLVVLSND